MVQPKTAQIKSTTPILGPDDMEIGKTHQMPIDPETVKLSAAKSIQDWPDALIELITNSDDAYHKLFLAGKTVKTSKRGRKRRDGGDIYIEHIEIREKFGGKAARRLVVRDRATGMDKHDMFDKLFGVGGRKSGDGDRGFFNRGAKDVSILGTTVFESVKDGLYYQCIIENIVEFDWEVRDGEPVSDEKRKEMMLRPGDNGTSVTILLDDDSKLPRLDTLISMLPELIQLRGIAAEDSDSQLFVVKDEKRRKVVYYPPAGESVYDKPQSIFIDYKGTQVPATFDMFISESPLNADKRLQRQAGFLIQGDKAIYQCSFLNPSINRNEFSRYFFGILKCPYIDTLRDQYRDRMVRGQKRLANNPNFIIDPDRRAGLTEGHPFVQALASKIAGIMEPKLKALKDKAKPKSKGSLGEDLKKRLGKISDFLSKLLKSEEVEVDDADKIVEKTGTPKWDTEAYRKNGITLVSPANGHKVGIGQDRYYSVYAKESMIKKLIKSDNDLKMDVKCVAENSKIKGCVHINKRKITLEKVKGRNQYRTSFKVTGQKICELAEIWVSNKVLPKASEILSVVDPFSDHEFEDDLEFEHQSYTVKYGQKRRIRFFYNGLKAASGKITSSEPGNVGCVGETAVVERLPKFSTGTFEIRGKTLNSLAEITIDIHGKKGSVPVKVVPPTYSDNDDFKVQIEILNENLGRSAAVWMDEEGNAMVHGNRLAISASHVKVKPYLGDAAANWPGQNEPAGRQCLADIITRKVAEKILLARADTIEMGSGNSDIAETIMSRIWEQESRIYTKIKEFLEE